MPGLGQVHDGEPPVPEKDGVVSNSLLKQAEIIGTPMTQEINIGRGDCPVYSNY